MKLIENRLVDCQSRFYCSSLFQKVQDKNKEYEREKIPSFVHRHCTSTQEKEESSLLTTGERRNSERLKGDEEIIISLKREKHFSPRSKRDQWVLERPLIGHLDAAMYV